MNALDLLDPNLALVINGRPVLARRGPTRTVDPTTGEEHDWIELWTAGGPDGPDPEGAYSRSILRADLPITIEQTPPPTTYSVPG